jgi:hypothetical protein
MGLQILRKHLERSGKQITERYEINLELHYHNIMVEVIQLHHKNYEAINTTVTAIKKRMCYKDRLPCCNTNTPKNLIENRIEKKRIEEY